MTSLYSGERLPKSDPVFGILGKADELNVWIGDAHILISDADTKEQLRHIQSTLFAMSANIATPRSSSTKRKKDRTEFDPNATPQIETWIDRIQATLPPLKNFVFPSGDGPVSSTFHHARSTCRELERKLTRKTGVDPHILSFVNRLSDYLFVQARAFSPLTETTWSP